MSEVKDSATKKYCGCTLLALSCKPLISCFANCLQIYNKYGGTRDSLRVEKAENARLKGYLHEILEVKML